jgi:hypothetical protein
VAVRCPIVHTAQGASSRGEPGGGERCASGPVAGGPATAAARRRRGVPGGNLGRRRGPPPEGPARPGVIRRPAAGAGRARAGVPPAAVAAPASGRSRRGGRQIARRPAARPGAPPPVRDAAGAPPRPWADVSRRHCLERAKYRRQAHRRLDATPPLEAPPVRRGERERAFVTLCFGPPPGPPRGTTARCAERPARLGGRRRPDLPPRGDRPLAGGAPAGCWRVRDRGARPAPAPRAAGIGATVHDGRREERAGQLPEERARGRVQLGAQSGPASS